MGAGVTEGAGVSEAGASEGRIDEPLCAAGSTPAAGSGRRSAAPVPVGAIGRSSTDSSQSAA